MSTNESSILFTRKSQLNIATRPHFTTFQKLRNWIRIKLFFFINSVHKDQNYIKRPFSSMYIIPLNHPRLTPIYYLRNEGNIIFSQLWLLKYIVPVMVMTSLLFLVNQYLCVFVIWLCTEFLTTKQHYNWNLHFLNNVIIIKAKILLPQA